MITETTEPAKPAMPPQAREYNAAVHARLIAHLAEENKSVADVAREIGVAASAVSKYKTGKPEGNVQRMESLLEDLFKNTARRKLIQIKPGRTSVAVAIQGAFMQILRTGDVGLIHGNAGVGKTMGIHYCLPSNPTAVFTTASKWHRDYLGLVQLLWDSVETRTWRNNQKKADFLVEKFRGSNRLWIVDNAHRITPGGFDFLFDFHDATGVPVALVGNPGVLEVIRRNDQHFSRIGIIKEVVLENPAEDSVIITSQLAPEFNGSIAAMAEEIASEQGHLRTLKKTTLLAQDIVATPVFQNLPPETRASKAMAAAQTRLVRPTASPVRKRV